MKICVKIIYEVIDAINLLHVPLSLKSLLISNGYALN